MTINGTQYGSWAKVPLQDIVSESVIYSFGAGEDICYEFLLSGLCDPEIHIFDPTPRSVEHYEYCSKVFTGETKPNQDVRFGGGDLRYNNLIINSNANLSKLSFHDYGLYNENSSFKFFYPKNKDHISLSIDNLQNTNDYIDLDVKKIDTILEELGHSQIDLLKLNIEGAEVKSLLHMMKNTEIRPRYIAVKFELVRNNNSESTSLISEIKSVLLQEYEVVYTDKIENYTLKFKN